MVYLTAAKKAEIVNHPAVLTTAQDTVQKVLDETAAAIAAHKGAAVADLNQTISDPPTQAEVQALSDKVDALLASLRAAGLLAA